MNAVGQPISRVDGRLKVTGGARYTADIPFGDIAHAAIAYSTIANGRTVSIDTAAAEKAPGVLAVFTHHNMPRMNPVPWSHLRPIADAAVTIEQIYRMPDRHHNPMEPHATLAVWDDAGTLTLYDSTQMVVGTRKLASLVLGISEEKINVVCEYLGGGFGGKSWSWPHTLLAALAAKVAACPPAAYPCPDVFEGGPPGGDRSDDRSGCRP